MRFYKKKFYCITFLDHAVGVHKPITCRVVGELYNSDKDSLYFVTWIPISSDKELVENNLEKITILKSTIIEVSELVKKKRAKTNPDPPT